MADKQVIEEVRVLKRGGGAAATFAFLALLVAIAALIIALRASHTATTQKTRVDQLDTHINTSLGQDKSANTGAGSGDNAQQPVAGSNATPNGNGQ